MKLEHFALNVEDPLAMAAWYEEHLGMKAVRKQEIAPYTVFLADESGRIMIEIYNNPPKEVPGYRQMDPLQVHLAYVSVNPAADKVRLEKAGATTVTELNLPDGSILIMMRDPWGLAVQLCKRGVPMLAEREL
ncbi:MAG: ribosomal protein [Segetibacter sp.]|jgi:catechol 2,3-dioxygenase-like lactoylglutathione lyase family enzyme|nr:ribosomal protein [Segetibacter sp.]